MTTQDRYSLELNERIRPLLLDFSIRIENIVLLFLENIDRRCSCVLETNPNGEGTTALAVLSRRVVSCYYRVSPQNRHDDGPS